MKSKKIVALIVAFAAFMAVATSGLAAVTSTTTTYLTDKVEVTAVVGAEAGKEVTYLVADSDGDIVYIDQKTATGGTATFEYKIAKNKIPDLVTSVKLGTDGNEAVNEGNKNLEFGEVTVNSDAGVASVTFHTDANCTSAVVENTLGTEDTIYALVTPKQGYEIDSVTVGENVQDKNGKYSVKKGNVLTIVTKQSVVEPSVEYDNVVIDNVIPEGDEEFVGNNSYSVANYALKVTGNPRNAGILDGNIFYEALKASNESEYDVNKIYAVRIITEGDSIVNGVAAFNVDLENVAN